MLPTMSSLDLPLVWGPSCPPPKNRQISENPQFLCRESEFSISPSSFLPAAEGREAPEKISLQSLINCCSECSAKPAASREAAGFVSRGLLHALCPAPNTHPQPSTPELAAAPTVEHRHLPKTCPGSARPGCTLRCCCPPDFHSVSLSLEEAARNLRAAKSPAQRAGGCCPI